MIASGFGFGFMPSVRQPSDGVTRPLIEPECWARGHLVTSWPRIRLPLGADAPGDADDWSGQGARVSRERARKQATPQQSTYNSLRLSTTKRRHCPLNGISRRCARSASHFEANFSIWSCRTLIISPHRA